MTLLAKQVVRHRYFEMTMACAIAVNGLVLVIETDARGEDTPFWLALDWTFTVLFLTEMLLRMAALRRKWHKSAWNLFDAVLVAISFVDVVVLPLMEDGFESLRVLSVFRVVRIFRMLRILRLLRVFRFAHQLVLLLYAIWAATRAMFWAMALVSLVLYTFGMLLTKLVGKNCCDEDDLFQDERIREWYGTLPRTLFTLFQFTTLEGWPDIARVTLTSHPWLTVFYIFFILLTSISLLNTVAGVLTESILETSRRKLKESQDKQERELQDELQALGAAFIDGFDGPNGRAKLDVPTFEHAAWQPGPLREFLQKAQYVDDKGIDPALDLFNLLLDDDEAVSRESFVEAVQNSHGPLKSKHLLALKRDVCQLNPLLEEASSLLERVSEQVRELQGTRTGATGADALRQEVRTQLSAMGGPRSPTAKLACLELPDDPAENWPRMQMPENVAPGERAASLERLSPLEAADGRRPPTSSAARGPPTPELQQLPEG